MKKQLLTLIAAASLSTAFSQSIPNGGFENWTQQSCINPQYYTSSSLQNHGGGGGFGPINAVQTTDAFHGSFAVKLSTVLTSNDTSAAYIANFPTNQSGIQWGGSAYSQQPTGLNFHYKCNVMPGDSALVIVIFKKSGVIFSQNIKKVTGTINTYSLGVMTFSLSQVPDTVMFGATSSNSISGNFKGIPGSMLQIDSVNFTGASGQPTNFNGDFETWVPYTTNPNLTGWNFEYNTINNQTTDKFAGTYAVELKTTQLNNANDSVYSSFATTGYFANGPVSGGYPYTQTVDTLKFNYKYVPTNANDSAQVQLSFKKAGNTFAYYYIQLKAAASYTQAVMSYSLSQTPDTVIVNINSSKRWLLPISYLGADLKVDNMYFKSQALPVTNYTLQASGCTNQAIQLTDMSGNIPTTWTWTTVGGNSSGANTQNPTVTYTATGTYTVTLNVSNGSGSGTPVSQVISIAPSPNVTATSTVVCMGNNVTLTAGGANTYTWSTSATTNTISVSPTTNSTYTVTGTVGGCTNMAVSTITVNALPGMNITGNSTICSGQSTVLTANGAGTYTWTAGPSTASYSVSPTVNATYTVAGTGPGNCVNTATAVVTVNPTPTVCIGNNNPVCVNQTISLNYCGSSVTSYTWTGPNTFTSNVAAPSIPNAILADGGTYSLSVTDANGCTNSSTSNVGVNSLPTLTVTVTNASCPSCTDGSAMATGGGTTYTLEPGNIFSANATTLSVGTYTYCTANSSGCVTCNTFTVSFTTGINNLNANEQFSIYPNPSNGLFTINVPEANATATVFDLTGKKIALFNLSNTKSQIDLSAYNDGIYFIEITTTQGVFRKKITKTN